MLTRSTSWFASFFSVRRGGLHVLLLGLLLAAFAVGCRGGGSADGGGLLAGKKPHRSQGAREVARLTDGLVPPTGSAWNSNRATVLSSRHAFVDYDLGESRTIVAAALLGDNNDQYELLTSEDGTQFETLWAAPTVGRPGMQWRSTKDLSGRGRYLRVRAQNGDASLGLAEVVAYAEVPATLPPKLRPVSAGDPGVQFRSVILVCLAAWAGLLLVARRSMPLWMHLGLGLAAAGTLFYGLEAFFDGRPFGAVEVSFVRAAAATLALFVVIVEAFSPKREESVPWLNVSLLGIAAFVSLAAFFNLGTPQFYDEKNREPSLVHNYDMRVYFPVAKYFDELRYDGLYLASVATFAEEHGGVQAPVVQNAELRDLRDHRMRKVKDITPEVVAIKQRFSPERWEALKTDMRYFWETMGTRAYLGSMADHGGNATPVWLSVTHLLFKGTSASNGVLLAAAALDPLLLLLFAVVVFRTFGARTALVSLVIFGANDYYMFGSNWAGATLRNDWMVFLGLGVCALKVGRYRTGGALLAMSALIRAFPAASLFALGVPVLWSLVEHLRREKAWPRLRDFVASERWFVETALGAAVCVGVSVAFSSLVLGPSSWPLWVKKISSFTASPHVNHMSLLTVTSGSEYLQAEVFRQRAPLHVALVATYVVLAIWAAYRRPPHVAALLGILLVPVFLYPANYYMHFVFLLALLVDEPLRAGGTNARRSAGHVWTLLLVMCAALYLFVKEAALELHFYNGSVVLMATLAVVLVALLPRRSDGEFLVPLTEGEGAIPISPSAGVSEVAADRDGAAAAETTASERESSSENVSN